MADDTKNDNVVPFRKPQPPRPRRGRVRHHQGPKVQFQHHDKVVRLHVRGLVQNDAFVRWLVEHATALHLDGWARSAPDNSMDILIAGEVGDVRQMLELINEGPRPVDMLLAEEVVLKGDEPMWQGFHHLSPHGT
ncbi:acylphosphatase [Magnetovibrio sp.]|uniref:acylphosphatase n=1 Tax=Magnetovibrio sp. TaxID=2024836 RepID=UPI002F93CA20